MAEKPETGIDTRVGQYIQLRDHIKELDNEHKQKMAPYRELLADLNSVLLDHMNSLGADSCKTPMGTVYKTVKKQVSVADMSAFWTHVVVTGDFDLVDKKANVTGVSEYIEKNGVQPPGVNYNETFQVGVRRK